MIYKNLSRATKTFYGVTFKPGEEHDVPGYINDPKFVKCTAYSIPKSNASKKSSSTIKTKTTKEVTE